MTERPTKTSGRASRTSARPHCADHRVYSPKCARCQADGGDGHGDRRVIGDPLRTDENWRRMTEIALRERSREVPTTHAG